MARTSTFTLSVGSLVGSGLTVYLRNFVPFTLLSVIVLSPWIAFRLFVMPPIPDDRDPLLMQFTDLLLSSLLTYLLTGAVTYGVVMQLRGQPAGVATALSRGLQTFGAVLGTGILCGVRIVLFTFLLIVPGIIQSVRLYVALPVAVMEGKSGSAAMRRSETLTSGSGWPIFGAWLLIVVLGVGLVFVSSYLLIASAVLPPSAMPWVEIVIALLVNAFAATLMAVCYFQLRGGKENVDAKALAAVFD